MGRKYTRVKVFFNDNCVENLNAFIDSGSDLTIIEINIQAEDDKKEIFLDETLIDDGPLDEENNEEVIIELDYLQKAKKILKFDD